MRCAWRASSRVREARAEIADDMQTTGVLLLFVCLLETVEFGNGLKCAQCASVHTKSCESGKVEPADCSGLYQGAMFCVTYSGTITRGRVVFRDCSYVNMASICKSQLLENERTEVCYESCSSDGCNAVSKSSQPHPWLELMAFTVGLFLL